jgi:hypothetical protein
LAANSKLILTYLANLFIGLAEFIKWEFFDSIYGNSDVQEFKAVYHYDKTDKGVKPQIFCEGRRIIKR